jgi:hypothetical protein
MRRERVRISLGAKDSRTEDDLDGLAESACNTTLARIDVEYHLRNLHI